ncbi:MAG: hypothetical protein Q8P24_03050 [Desulfobacterales bacterium]|nr:hypothetical protein [Desulfobacterales bacterium]
MKKRSPYFASAYLLAAGLLAIWIFQPVLTHAAPFYQGKTIEILGESRVGGGTDTMARITAAVLPMHIPGNPKIVVRSMPGGGGSIANNIFYARGKPDGLHLLQNSSSPVSMQQRGNEIVKYDLRKLEHIGHVVRGGNVIFIRKGKMKNLLDPKAEPAVVGTKEGEETWLAMLIWGKEFLDWNIRFIPGYTGTSDIELAFQRGEVDVFGTSNSFLIKRLLEQDMIELVCQNGTYKKGKFKRRPDFADVQTFEDLLVSKNKKPTGVPWQAYIAWLGSNMVDKSLSAPRNTPEKYVSILRTAFDKMGEDPKFDALITKMVTPVYDVVSGTDTRDVLDQVLGAPKEAIDYGISLQKKFGLIAQ